MAPAKQEKAPPYGKEEKVLCFHGDLMYEAKIIDVRVEPGKKADDAQYRIHYKGWKSSWDDWVTHDRIRKFTEDNKQLAAQLAQARTRTPGSKGAKKGVKATGSEMSSARGSEERAAASSSFAGRGPRRGRDYELETHTDMVEPSLLILSTVHWEPYRVQDLGCDMAPRTALPTLRSKDFGPGTQQPVPFDPQSAPTIPSGSVTAGDHRLITQSFSLPLPAKDKSTKRCKTAMSRKPVTRGDAEIRKRIPPKKLAGKDPLMMMETLPKESHSFLENEMRWANAAADLDFLLKLPRPNYKYAASLPSQLIALGFSEDYACHETANDALQEEAFHSRPSVKLIIPDVIKALLVDDWENVTKNMQLVPLPHPKPVTKILADYSEYEMPKRPAGSSHADILEETLAGIKEYFDKSLGRILLYKFERPQYAEVHKKWDSTDPEFQGKTASDTYGAEHLCRLIVSLPELIAQTNMDQQSVNRLREELAKFSTWLSKNTAEYFASSYETPAQDYVDKAKN
ncbi:hypothetical protein CIB48_g8702 [Xylaria polymorpha]|nr:hypothetical protein CIB48_g8702 [Xylaria polymorpha]